MPTNTKPALVGPRHNLNGGSRESLITQYSNALDALDNAAKALREMAPHGRDYQTMPEGSYRIARDQHLARQVSLHAILAEVMELAEEFATS